MVTDLMESLRKHAERSRRLWLLEHPTDVEVASLYEHAAGLLFLSKGEGFGLPLVEAANYGAAILCSDIPVFREIAGHHATFSTAVDAVDLASEIAAWNTMREAGRIPSSSEMPRLTWEQSAEQLLGVVLEDSWLQEDPGDGNPDAERADAVREEVGAPVAVEPQES
jgi:glycosyltransferase involved in cell wall biosynthesis